MTTTESSNKRCTIIKTTPGNVLFYLSPVDNPAIRREIYLTDRHPRQAVPLSFALNAFYDNGVFALYRDGKFTFDDNDAIKQIANVCNISIYNTSKSCIPLVEVIAPTSFIK